MAKRKILLVEGTDDKHVVMHLCGASGGLWIDDIESCGGVHKLLESFPVRLKGSDAEGSVVGMVIDADLDSGARWASISTQLKRLNYERVPNKPVPTGAIFESPVRSLLPRFGVWLMPDNSTTGTLEHFLQCLVPRKSLLFEHVIHSIASIPQGQKLFTNEAKAKIHTWLAWQEEPGKPLGQAISAKFLKPDAPEAIVFMAWLSRLYLET